MRNQSVTGRGHRLDELNLDDVVDIDLAVEGHLCLISTVSGCVLHSDGDESGGGVRTRGLENVKFLDLSKGQQERLKLQALREE